MLLVAKLLEVDLIQIRRAPSPRIKMDGQTSTEPTPEQKSWMRELGRARVFLFFWVFALVAILNTVTEENDILLHVVDDYTDGKVLQLDLRDTLRSRNVSLFAL